jgi:hypothetical protein
MLFTGSTGIILEEDQVNVSIRFKPLGMYIKQNVYVQLNQTNRVDP